MPIPRALVYRMAEEIYEVAVESGVNLPRDLPLMTLNSAASVSSMTPSMLQDFRTGRELEIESLCGKALINVLKTSRRSKANRNHRQCFKTSKPCGGTRTNCQSNVRISIELR